MAETKETIADIVAEMRRYGSRHWMHDEGQSAREFADRIEAAAKRDEELIAALLYYHLEDYCESIAPDGYKRVIKAAFRRIGVKYEPFGLDADEVVLAHMKGELK